MSRAAITYLAAGSSGGAASKVAIFFLAIAGVPLFAVIATSVLFGNEAGATDIQIAFDQFAGTPLLEALPLFAFAGAVLSRSQAPNRLLRLANAYVGFLPGGLAVVSIIALTLLSALTGASGVTIVALGTLVHESLRKEGYSERFSLGLVTAGGALGLLFPPSLPIILFGVVSRASIDDLFAACAIPGLVAIGLLSAYSVVQAIRSNIPRRKFSLDEVFGATRAAWAEVPIPVIVLVGIYQGWFTVSEAAVATAVLIMIAEFGIYRDVSLRVVGAAARESAVLSGGILIILAMSIAASSQMMIDEVPQKLYESVAPYLTSELLFLVGLNLFLLFIGCMIDVYAATVLLVPLILPISEQFGIDPLHLGAIFLTNLGIGYATPPVGANLFIASIHFEKPVLSLYRAAIPFILIMLASLVITTAFPRLSVPSAGSDAASGDPSAPAETTSSDEVILDLDELGIDFDDEFEDLDDLDSLDDEAPPTDDSTSGGGG